MKNKYIVILLMIFLHVLSYAQIFDSGDSQGVESAQDVDISSSTQAGSSTSENNLEDTKKQDEENAKIQAEKEKEIQIIKETLEFGTDNAVVEQLKLLGRLGVDDYTDLVFERMKGTKNEGVLQEGYTYLREIKFEDAIDFSLNEILAHFRDYPIRAVQFAIFYLTDMVDLLSDEQQNVILDNALKLVNYQNPALVQPILHLVTQFYSEGISKENIEKTIEEEASLENENTVTQDVVNDEELDSGNEESLEQEEITEDTQENNEEPPKKEPRKAFRYITDTEDDDRDTGLFSYKLKKLYEDISVGSIKDEIIITLGEIQAYEEADFILDIAEDTNVSQARRRAAIIAAGAFSFPSFDFNFDELQKRRMELFEKLKEDPIPNIRIAVYDALQINNLPQEQGNIDKETFLSWVKTGLRDNDEKVRSAVLKRMEESVSDIAGLDELETLFKGVVFVSQHDASNEVKAQAVSALSSFPSEMGKTYILDKVRKLKTISFVDKQYIQAAMGAYIDSGGVEAVQDLVNTYIKEDFTYNTFSEKLALMQYISEVIAFTEDEAVKPLVKILLFHPDTTIQSNIVTAVGKNKFFEFINAVEDKVDNIELPAELRVISRKVVELLKKAQKTQ